MTSCENHDLKNHRASCASSTAVFYIVVQIDDGYIPFGFVCTPLWVNAVSALPQ